MNFETWKKQLLEILSEKGIRNIELDEDLIFMAFDMEGKSPQETADEIMMNRPNDDV